jgi:hypothetical protein
MINAIFKINGDVYNELVLNHLPAQGNVVNFGGQLARVDYLEWDMAMARRKPEEMQTVIVHLTAYNPEVFHD